MEKTENLSESYSHPIASSLSEQVNGFDLPVRILLAAIWFGMVTGLAEAGYLAYRKLQHDWILQLSRDVYWMAPVSDVMILLVPAVGLIGLAIVRSSFVTHQVYVFVFAFPGFLTLALHFERISKSASLILALGLAFQTSRLAAKYPDKFDALVRRSLPALIVATILFGVLMRSLIR